jgi:hypothetical protein
MKQHRGFMVCAFASLGLLAGGSVSQATLLVDARSLTDRTAVDAFLRAHAGDAYDDATLGDYRILDLGGDGKADLIATLDYSGRRFFNHLIVLHDDGHKIAVQEIDVWQMEALDGVVQDLDADGRSELLLRQGLTPYLGARPMASWTAVFRFSGHQLVDQSAMFPHYYETRISRLDHELAALGPSVSADPYHRGVLTIERDKLLRLLGLSPNAGLDSALRWARSEDPVYRVFAVAILSELDGEAAFSTLRALVDDSNSEVAAHARVAVELKRSRLTAH